MRTAISIMAFILFVTACSTLKYEQKKPDGEECKVSHTSLFINHNPISGTACGAKVNSEGSQVDDSAILKGLEILGGAVK